MKIEVTDEFYSEKNRVLQVLSHVIDPELEINIVDLGLIYEINFREEKKIQIIMTFSTPGCPLGESIENGVKNVLTEEFPSYQTEVEIVFEPLWSVELISEKGKQQLGIK